MTPVCRLLRRSKTQMLVSTESSNRSKVTTKSRPWLQGSSLLVSMTELWSLWSSEQLSWHSNKKRRTKELHKWKWKRKRKKKNKKDGGVLLNLKLILLILSRSQAQSNQMWKLRQRIKRSLRKFWKKSLKQVKIMMWMKVLLSSRSLKRKKVVRGL